MSTTTQLGHWLRSAYAVTVPSPASFTRLLGRLPASATNADDSAFASDLALMRPRLAAYARRLSRDASIAEDLVQDAMLRAWSARGRFTPGTNLGAWTRTILRNCFLSQVRRGARNVEYDERAAEVILSTREAQTGVIELADVLQALGSLPDSQRLALEAVVIDGMTYEEAADRLGLNLGTLRSRIARARTRMRMVLGAGVASSPTGEEEADSAAAEPHRRPLEVPSGTSLRHAWSIAKAEGRTLMIG